MRKKIFLSCVVASLIATSGYAMSQDTVINDKNTTGVFLREYQGLNITSTGSIENDNLLSAVDSNSSVHINNSGKIIIHSDSNSSVVMGIKQNINMYGDIVNTGIIDISNSNARSVIGINEDISSSEERLDINNSINNSGKIIANSSNADAIGISIGSLNFADSTIYLNDHINNINGDIVNSGDIVANGKTNAFGILEYSDGNNSSGDIKNSGNISVNSQETSVGIYRGNFSGAMSGDIINSGSITAIGQGAYDIGIAEVGYNSNNTSIINSGTITAHTAFWVNGYDDYSDVNSTILSNTILNSGTINTYNIVAPYSNLINSGKINLHGHETTRLYDFQQTKSGVLSIDANLSADGNASNPTISALHHASIADGSTINVNIISSSDTITQSFLDNNGTISNVVTAKNGIDANASELSITDNSPILDFQAFIDNNETLSLKAIKNKHVSPENTPLIAVSAPIVEIQTLNVLNSVVQNRQDNARGLGSGDIAFSDKHLWFKPFGMYTKQDDKDSINGFDANTYGFGLGADGEYKEGRRAGFAFFYSNSKMDINHISQSSDSNIFNLIAYGSNPMIDDKTMMFYQAGIGIQRSTSKRYVTSISKTAKANYTSKSFYIQAKATRDYDINDKLIITPAVKGSLRYFKTPSYSETGANANNLNIDSTTTTQVLFGISADMKYKINDSTKLVSNFALNYDFNNDAQSVDATYQGTPGIIFNTKGIKNSAFGYGLGLGVSKKLKKGFTVNVKYDLSGRGSDFTSHAVMAKLKWIF